MRRTYSVWSHDAGRLSLCVLDHGGDGPGSLWARAVRPGQEVLFSRPEGNLVARPAAVHVFAGEETAAVAFGAMIAAVGDADVRGVIEVGEPGDWLPRPDGRPWPDGIVWRYRDGAPATMSPTLTEAVADLDLPPEPGAAYVAGEAHTVQAVARHLVRERGWPRRAVRTKPFWSPGRAGMD
jgi:NADPH-dependent ferric siderophore reductase